MRIWQISRWSFIIGAAVFILLPASAFSHVGSSSPDHSPYAWNFTFELVLGMSIAAAIYANGLRVMAPRSAIQQQRWRHVSYFCGLAAVFVALQSPLDAIANRSFFAHQIQHLLLQTAGPMLIMLSAPQRLLMAGTPAGVKHWLIVPVFLHPAARAFLGSLTLPWPATFLLSASLYIWHWPPYHDIAVLSGAVHYLMHFTLLAAGLLFYWCVFDPRPAPLGATYGTRWNMLVFAMSANMLLGAALALKSTAFYGAYDKLGRLWDLSALADERLGGLIMWIPGSMLCVPAFFVVLHMWNSRESRVYGWRRRGVVSTTRATRQDNYRLAFRLAAMVLAALAVTLTMGIVATGQLAKFNYWLGN